MEKQRIRQLLGVTVVVLAAFLCSRYLFQLALIQGESMAPAYHNYQLVVLNKLTREYTYGDVVAFHCEGLRAVLVKRVAACPGDTVQIIDGTLYVNDEKSCIYPDDGYFSFSGNLETPILLEEGEYVMLGDNANQSKDSRYESVGVVSRKEIIGKIAIPKRTSA